jgi:hypothetical protein
MITLQQLLDQEAELSNTGQRDSPERKKILTAIVLMRDESYRPVCYGEDDCSTLMLSQCAWRMTCGGAI